MKLQKWNYSNLDTSLVYATMPLRLFLKYLRENSVSTPLVPNLEGVGTLHKGFSFSLVVYFVSFVIFSWGIAPLRFDQF